MVGHVCPPFRDKECYSQIVLSIVKHTEVTGVVRLVVGPPLPLVSLVCRLWRPGGLPAGS